MRIIIRSVSVLLQNLNVYSARPLGIAGDLIAGYTKMPQFSALDPVTDGSVILHTTLPGGSEPGFNLGLTLGEASLLLEECLSRRNLQSSVSLAVMPILRQPDCCPDCQL
jgi:hypothetical protein